MINAEEHKKLLEQITALDRDSVNYFDVEREFFLIDSDNLSNVQPRLYGYSIQADGIYEEYNLTPEAVKNLDGRGCYVYIDVRDGQITIKQDLNGSWGIYLFRHGDYFALSNSFFRLLDYVKFRYPLTVNRDYCNFISTSGLCSIMYSETAVNEIEIVDRSAILYIDVAKKILQTELIDYKEQSIPLNSPEGIATLDSWVEFWGKVFRGVAQHTQFFQADLSGGFDSRISFSLLVHSGIDLNNMLIYSIKNDLHTHKEDYQIASQIANHYGFALNRPLPENKFLNCSLADVFNINLYSKQLFSNIPIFNSQKDVYKFYRLDGSAGEAIRHHWQIPPKEYLKNMSKVANLFSRGLARELSYSVANLLENGFRAVCDKHKITDPDSTDVTQCLYIESRSRNHFGKSTTCSYLTNHVRLSPALDPAVRTLRLDTPECPDQNLLVALLFTRHEPDLLKFPFNNNHSIAPETIAYAQKINEQFPRRMTTGNSDVRGGDFHLQPLDSSVEKILAVGRNNPEIPTGLLGTCLKAEFDSSRTYGLFNAYLNEELYRYAEYRYEVDAFQRFRRLYAICGVTKVLESVEISQRNCPPYQDIKRFLEQDFCEIPVGNDAEQILRRIARYITARIDVKLITKIAGGDLKILSVSDEKALISKPGWFQKGGVGYKINSYRGKLSFVAKAAVDGQILLILRGKDIHKSGEKFKRVPYWIDYTKLTVNKQKIFDTLTPAWHDKAYRHKMEVKADEEITIEIEWLPHRSDT